MYNETVIKVIKYLEGGYYHPNMLKDGRVKDQRYKNSGETMFGIDRVAGGTLNTSVVGLEFWSIIDRAEARNKWKWNYMGGELQERLTILAGQVIKPQFEYLFNKYLTAEARAIISNDSKLMFHFIYATWNGSGWFKKFALAFNDAVKQGRKDLHQIALDTRIYSKNSLIEQGGKKIQNLFIKNLV
jgi:hypothetical protein